MFHPALFLTICTSVGDFQQLIYYYVIIGDESSHRETQAEDTVLSAKYLSNIASLNYLTKY